MKLKITLIIVLIIVIPLITYNLIKEENDAKIFKKEYEQYNKYENYEKVKIKKNNKIIYLNQEELVKSIKEDDKIIFIASPKDNNSRKVIKLLLELTEEYEIDKIYYCNADKIKKESKMYKDLLKNKIKVITPTLILIKNKKIEDLYQPKKIDKKEVYKNYEKIIIKYTLCTKECN